MTKLAEIEALMNTLENCAIAEERLQSDAGLQRNEAKLRAAREAIRRMVRADAEQAIHSLRRELREARAQLSQMHEAATCEAQLANDFRDEAKRLREALEEIRDNRGDDPDPVQTYMDMRNCARRALAGGKDDA
jgi:paraquat-inducible protein B